MGSLKKAVSYLLITCMLLAVLPAGASAADGERVLNTIGYSYTDVAAPNASNSVVLTVPYSYAKDNSSLSLTSGLAITYDESVYFGVVVTPGSPEATIGGDPVSVTVTYSRVDEEDAEQPENTPIYSTVYNIRVVAAEKEAPSFAGIIEKGPVPPGTVMFNASDFLGRYEKNDGEDMGYVAITGSNPGFGELKLGGVSYTLGSKISVSDLGSLSFESSAGGTVSYTAVAYEGENEEPFGLVRITVTVISVPEITSEVTKTTYAGETCTFALSDFKYDLNDGNLSNIEITPGNSGFGVWKNGSTSFTSATTFTASTIANLKFEGAAEGVETFTWRVSNEAGYSEAGTGTVTISKVQVPTITGSVSLYVSAGSTLVFSLSDFSSRYNLNNGTLANIEITPTNSGFGTWYSGNTVFTTATTFTSSTIGSLKLRGDVAGKTVTFNWRVSNQSGYSASGTGTVTVVSALTLTSYNASTRIERGSVWTVAASHFAYSPTTKPVTYVRIKSVPASASGYLYLTTSLPANSTYGYPAINANTPLSDNATIPYGYLQYLRIYTQPAGTASTISFTWTATTDTYVSGAVWATAASYTVSFTSTGVRYETYKNRPVKFSASDFNTAYNNSTGYSLSYVTFVLPSSSRGTLYYNYNETTGTGTAVKAGTKYYRSSSPGISDITFVPASGYTGTVTITYYAYNSAGSSTTSTMTITVLDSDDTVRYETYKNEPVSFSASDFNTAYYNNTGYSLSYVTFVLPSSSRGTLYYNYDEDDGTGTAVKASTKYYRSTSPSISGITFVPASGYTGTVTITYYAYNSAGSSTTSTMTITVKDKKVVGTITYSTEEDQPLKFKASDFSAAFKTATGNTLSYVMFSLPSSSYGRLYYNYTNESTYGSLVSSSTMYSASLLSSISFVPNPSYTGTVTITYTAYSSSGSSAEGTIKINVTKSNDASDYFTDVTTAYSWAVRSIDYLFENGVITGVGNNKFNPAANMIRGDFILVLYRAFEFSGTGAVDFTDVPKTSYYYKAIAAARAAGIAQGDGSRFYPASSITRQDAMVLIVRTLKQSGINLPTGSSSDLAAYPDRGSISSYATASVASLVKAGIVEGSGGRLNPLANITRAEICVILYRIITTYGN
jgi:hypothetical protein